MKVIDKNIVKLAIAMLLFVFALGAGKSHAQTFKASDLNGTWMRDDGMMLNILGTGKFEEGGNAMVMAVGNSGWPLSAEKIAWKFRNLKHNGNNTWTGTNYKHMPESNYRKEDGTATLVMSDDRQSFKTQGFTYTKKY